MFEKEADSYANGFLKLLDWKQFDQHDKVVMFSAFKDGAEFGYNKAKKDINVATRWHKIADGDYPPIENDYCSINVWTDKCDIAYYVYNYNCWCVEPSGAVIEPPIAWCELPIFKEM